MSGILTKRRRYSRSESSVLIDIAWRFGATSVVSNVSSATSKAVASAPLASISHTSTRCPRRAATSASAAATVVLPTPPFPVTNNRSRSRSEFMIQVGVEQLVRLDAVRSAAETDRAAALLGAELDVGDLRRRDERLVAALVGDRTARRSLPTSAASIRCFRSSRSASSASSMPISRGACVTPMRTSTPETLSPRRAGSARPCRRCRSDRGSNVASRVIDGVGSAGDDGPP